VRPSSGALDIKLQHMVFCTEFFWMGGTTTEGTEHRQVAMLCSLHCSTSLLGILLKDMLSFLVASLANLSAGSFP